MIKDQSKLIQQLRRGIELGLTDKELTILFKSDFIPEGRRVRLDELSNLREIDQDDPDYFGLRCCQQTGNDVQSGPIHCGDLATHIADTKYNGAVAWCAAHVWRYTGHIQSSDQRRRQASLDSASL